MEIQEVVLSSINTLKVADAQTIACILIARKLVTWTPGHSARVNAQKHLNALSDLGKITKHAGFYRSLDSKSEYGDHSKKRTHALAQLLSISSINSTIYIEHELPVGLRADALVYIQKENRGLCFCLEIIHCETYSYLERKWQVWKSWKDKKAYLTKLFNKNIQYCGFVILGKEAGFATQFEEVLTCVSS